MPITPLLHITAAYSNAVLTAILPHVSDCASNLNLPIKQPVTAEDVGRFNASPYMENVGGGLWLTNHYRFVFSFGYVDEFSSPNDWFTIQDFDNVRQFVGKDDITTNDAVELARRSFVKLGYSLTDCNVSEQPSRLDGPYDIKTVGHIPYCRVVWQNPEATNGENYQKSFTVQFDIDMQRKQIVGMALSGTNFWRQNVEVGVKPELESDYRQRIQPKMFINTNAPRVLPPH